MLLATLPNAVQVIFRAHLVLVSVLVGLSFAKNRSDRKPCLIGALANETNQVRGALRLPADNQVTQRYVPPRPASRFSRTLTIDVETWVLAPDAFLANHRIASAAPGAIRRAAHARAAVTESR